jgi:uncharacterized membrane protein HdeD (DUF308 family)
MEMTPPQQHPESRFRKVSGGLAALGGLVFFIFLKFDVDAIPMGIGTAIWIFWIARALFPAMPKEIRLTGWSVSLVWHVLIVLPAPFYLLHPAGIFVLFHCVLAGMFSLEGIRLDRPARRVW